MATSGNTISLLTRNDIIESALRKLVVIEENQTPSPKQTSDAAQALNLIVAEFRTLGMSVWARKDMLIPLVTGQKDYVLGVGQTINVPYPMYIYQVLIESPPYDTQIQVMQRAKIDFNLLPFGSMGMPVSFTYQPGINVGTLSVWPTPDLSVPVGTQLFVTYQRPIEVFDAATDTPDFPQEWGNALIYNLAMSLADEFGVAADKQARIEKSAGTHLATAISNSTEQGSMFFMPDWRGSPNGVY